MRKIERLFVCVGAQKSGTTWLYRQFENHPDVATTFFKEVHYFDQVHCGTSYLADKRYEVLLWHCQNKPEEVYRWMTRDQPSPGSREVGRILDAVTQHPSDAWYVETMTTDKAWAMDFSPGYAVIGATGFRHMQQLANRLELCFVMRNPVERAWSSLVHEFTLGVLRQEGVELAQVKEARLRKWLDDPEMPMHRLTDYMATLDALLQVFNPGQIELMFHEGISADPARVVGRLYDRLGLDRATMDPALLQERVFESPKVPIPAAIRRHLARQWQPMVQRLHNEVLPVPVAWRETFGIS